MKEKLVQWTMLKNLDYLSQLIGEDIKSIKGQEVSTDFGRIDFILNLTQQYMVVELETRIDNIGKMDYCIDQIRRYQNISFGENTRYAVLFADSTPEKYQNEIIGFCYRNDILHFSYDLEHIKQKYSKTVQRLSLSFGLELPAPTNYTISYLRWLNKIIKPFYDEQEEVLSEDAVAHYFTGTNTTNFRCYKRLALDFEMFQIKDQGYQLTEYGKTYKSHFNPDIDSATNPSTVNMSLEQKKILLHVLTNGNWTKHKVNIYWFLRFVEVTGGQWLPNQKQFDEAQLSIANGLFGVSYLARTMYEFLNFACNWCQELELVERIRTKTDYDNVFLSPLGIELNNIFSLDLQLKKTRLNLHFKYID